MKHASVETVITSQCDFNFIKNEIYKYKQPIILKKTLIKDATVWNSGKRAELLRPDHMKHYKWANRALLPKNLTCECFAIYLKYIDAIDALKLLDVRSS